MSVRVELGGVGTEGDVDGVTPHNLDKENNNNIYAGMRELCAEGGYKYNTVRGYLVWKLTVVEKRVARENVLNLRSRAWVALNYKY